MRKENVSDLVKSHLNSSVSSFKGFETKLIENDYSKGMKLLSFIQDELDDCDEFILSAAFITHGGIALIKQQLINTLERGVKGKILTSDYLMFNKPSVYLELLKFPNIEVKVSSDTSFHAKGYFFKMESQWNCYIGSSNLTQSAMTTNLEWNLKISALPEGAFYKNFEGIFNSLWDISDPVSADWVSEYAKKHDKIKELEKQKRVELQAQIEKTIKPNYMQKEAMDSLNSLRDRGENKAILVSATGTGKTYLSALDVKQYIDKYKLTNPKVVFVVHRENIARKSLESFRNILGADYTYGLLTGSSKNYDSNFIFSTIQTIAKEEHRNSLGSIDYLIIDETHRAGAKSYLNILSQLKFNFLLGMTATPDRTDGYNIYKLFDNNIAFDVRLKDAMEENLLCPFHYYGITELEIEGEEISDLSNFELLVSDDRVDYLIDKINLYTRADIKAKGLIFCSRVEEAESLSELFNKKGYKTIALSGSTKEEDRQLAIDSLESDDENSTEYIFTVDIFNEGVDIPKINQIIMIRPTQSAIIFVQQLGRGLRKAKSKSYVTILDFIGNYQNNYMIPVALYGDRSLDKDNLRKFLHDKNTFLPGESSISFDRIAEKRIYDAINNAKMDDMAKLKNSFVNLMNKLDRVPLLMDFVDYGELDPILFVNKSKSYLNFIRKTVKEFKIEIEEREEKFLEFIQREVCNSKRPDEAIALKELINNGVTSEMSENRQKSLERILNREFFSTTVQKKYNFGRIVDSVGNKLKSTDVLKEMVNRLKQDDFLKDSMNYAIYKGIQNNSELKLYQKYTRKDACQMLDLPNDEQSVIYGYKTINGQSMIFVTYDKKNSDMSNEVMYEDEFNSSKLMRWFSKDSRTMDSPDVRAILDSEKNGGEVHLFVQKTKGEKSFYYLGKVHTSNSKLEKVMKKNKEVNIVSMDLSLETPVENSVYRYLTDKI